MSLFNRVTVKIAPLNHFSIPRLLLIVPLLLLMVQPLLAQEVPLALPSQEADAAAPRAFLETQILTSPVPETFDLYGSTLAIEGNIILVGSPYDNTNTGAVYVYEPDATGVWNQTAKLVPDTANLSNLFGWALDLEGGVAAIGAPSESAVYLFAKDAGGVWTQQQKIQGDISDGLGNKLVLNGTQLAAQAYYKGSIEIYQQVSLVWQLQDSIELVNVGGNPYAIFAFDGDTLLQGGAYAIDGAGEVLAYEFNGTDWEVTQRLRSTVRTSAFGASVALKGDEAFISTQDPSGYGSASVEVFENQSGVWVSKQLIAPVELLGSYGYPTNIVVAEDYLIVSNFYNSTIYLFTYNGTEWEFADRLSKQPANPNGQPIYFGYGADFSGGTLVASIPYAQNGGQVYIYGRLAYEPTALLVNGGFEDEVNGWTLKNASSDKVKCADATTPAEDIAWEGDCAFAFKGKPGEAASLKQVIESDLVAGTSLYFGGYAKAKGAGAYSRIKVALSYVDDSVPSSKIMVDVFSFGGEPAYVPLNFYAPNLILPVNGEAEKVKVQINSFGESGKLFFDELSLVAR